MPKIYATVSDETMKKLNDISEKKEQSFSKTTYEMINLGLISYNSIDSSGQKKLPKYPDKFDLKNREYLIRILSINSEILRKIYGEPSKSPDKKAGEILSEIKLYAENVIENEL